ncbi:FAD-dependent oxidoreductase [Kaistia sp. 32K]|uniref:FAD/NAD(P)-binding protein n=1 Tax=Kaistia sp. 32K TaxID=2795690 RepID=UPI001914E044|nr:FAD-dependent oxidoreductase [Kaistia sp. 32K]BCP52156.1 FAD-dependent oxidoreductase [Kaistia sp. 32K]
MTRRRRRPSVVVVGGGFTGAAVAYHLAARRLPRLGLITVVEPRPLLGAGLAYSSAEAAHRINVPAARMSLISEQPSHFTEWLQRTGAADRDAETPEGHVFAQRRLFGLYVDATLLPLLGEGLIHHSQTRAVAVERQKDRFRVGLEDGKALEADFVVLAATHPAPSVPAVLEPLADRQGFVANAYAPDAIEGIGPRDRVLIVGNGLTSADIIAALDARGHTGPITALSRHGLRSKGHAASAWEPRGDFTTAPASTVRQLLGNIRAELDAGQAAGESWHSVFDALRDQGGAIWAALPPEERRRLVRHLRVIWDIHRFRIAPQVEAVLQRRIAEGRLQIRAGSLVSANSEASSFVVGIRPRSKDTVVQERFDAVVVATGPAHSAVVDDNPALASLKADGLVTLDALGLGLSVDTGAVALDASGHPVSGLYVAGPLARGTFGELMGLLEVTRHAELVADRIASQIAD